MYYKFEEELKEAVILERPNRFIMNILIDGKVQKAHCPSTGKIGRFSFKNTPCLVSLSHSKTRKTKFTVEAISPQKPEAKRKTWIGINQGKMNSYIEFFLRNGFFKDMVSRGEDVLREKKLGNSRIDFKIHNYYVEVKTFLRYIPRGDLEYVGDENRFNSLERLIKHYGDLAKHAKSENGKAIVLISNMYHAKPFTPPKNSGKTKIAKTVRRAIRDGVENWQVNLKINKKGVYFVDYFKLNLDI